MCHAAQLPRGPRVRRRAVLERLANGGIATLGLGSLAWMMTSSRLLASQEAGTHPARRPVRVRIWCEATAPRSVYPDDVDGALAQYLSRHDALSVQRARLIDEDSGLSDAALDATDVLVWWGRLRHDDVPDDRARAVEKRVRDGSLGLVALHSACGSKPFKHLMGMSCEPGGWREDGRPEHVRVLAHDHPLARGVTSFTIPRSDMFAEPFNVPEPDALVLVSTWDQGESVRSGMVWTIDRGRVVYLRTGLDAFPVLFHSAIRQLVTNACLWAGRLS